MEKVEPSLGWWYPGNNALGTSSDDRAKICSVIYDDQLANQGQGGSMGCWFPSSSSNQLHHVQQHQACHLMTTTFFSAGAIAVTVAAAVCMMVLWLVLQRQRRLREQRERQEQLSRRRARTDSLGHQSSIRRFFQRSFDMEQAFDGADGGGEDDLLFDDVEIAKLEEHDRMLSAQTMKRFAYKGPLVHSISHKTMTPPPTWTEASRRLLPSHDRHWILHQSVSLNIGRTSTISFRRQQEPQQTATGPPMSASTPSSTKEDLTVSVHEVAVHVKPPLEGGVLQIYIKDSSQEEWMEHTFRSAAAAAQFQVDLLALQFLGQTIFRMYEALELIHRGSMAYTGTETVLHDRACDPDNLFAQSSGVAWDDVMRCLGSAFSSMDTRLEALRWMRTHGSRVRPSTTPSRKKQQVTPAETSDVAGANDTTTPAATTTTNTTISVGTDRTGDATHSAGLATQYVGKRLMLGIVDFFRLFVPLLPDVAVPQSASSRVRMEQLLRWRKRAARASVLVQAYVRARTVANQGWHLNRHTIPVGYLTRRLAFDENLDNVRHDLSARNEYYEAAVSRDVIFRVKGKEGLDKMPFWSFGFHAETSCRSHYQGYSLVGIHSLQWVADDQDFPLQPYRDPVLSIPSLRALIESNPELDFFVHAFFAEGRRCAMIVKVFVRSLPENVDESFDRVVNRFIEGDAELRKRKFECVLQLGVERDRLSLFAKLMLSLLSFLLRLTLTKRRRHVSQANISSDRTTIPSINISECGEVYHFGGSLQKDTSLPLNYLACTTHASSRRRNNLATRLFISYFESGGVSKDVVDFTYVLGADESDEVPERALGTVRIVNSPIKACALPIRFVTDDESTIRRYRRELPVVPPATGDFRLLFNVLVADPMSVAFAAFSRYFSLLKCPSAGISRVNPELATGMNNTSHDFNNFDMRASVVRSDDAIELAVNELIESLTEVAIPVRREQLVLGKSVGAHKSSTKVAVADSYNDVVCTPVLKMISREDIRRYLVASDGSLKAAAVRIVRSASWRGLTFPIDTRACRIELQSGQFFQQGRDLEGNPILYFRNLCLGQWRKNEDATIAAILHRLEHAVNDLGRKDPNVRFTLIVMMGRPYSRKDGNVEDSAASMSGSAHSNLLDDRSILSNEDIFVDVQTTGDNPRLQYSGEKWHTHTSKTMLFRLIDMLEAQYPERLCKALVVVGYGNTTYMRTALRGKVALSVAIKSKRTRERVRFLTKYNDLQKYVGKNVLVTLVGGSASVDPAAYEARE